VRSLDLTAHTSLSPIRRRFAPGFINYKKGALDSQLQVIIIEVKLIDLIDFWFFNATFSNISATVCISWRPVLVMEEAGVSRENYRPWASNW
jgi:hypothetical protein